MKHSCMPFGQHATWYKKAIIRGVEYVERERERKRERGGQSRIGSCVIYGGSALHRSGYGRITDRSHLTRKYCLPLMEGIEEKAHNLLTTYRIVRGTMHSLSKKEYLTRCRSTVSPCLGIITPAKTNIWKTDCLYCLETFSGSHEPQWVTQGIAYLSSP